ncbi:MAG: hypothetical protein ACR2NX_06525, partial [Chthoniobacterales bacterium]
MYLSRLPRLFVILVLLGQTAQGSPSAIEELTHLTQQADAARNAGDLPARLQAVLQVRKFLHDAPDAVAASAGALAEVGRKDEALDALDLLAVMGQSGDGLPTGKVFASLTDLPRYQEILRRLAANKA